MGYEMTRNLINGTDQLSKEARLYLCAPGPQLLVLDEGHRIRDPKSQLFAALTQISTSNRIILSGSPMQNHLHEYYVMVNYVRPGYLGTLKEFKTRFQEPIESGELFCTLF